ncbi:hypothetical protein TELCIR_10815 [Teladorsagia circumcincta]|uniref:Uncharacterized protein n=1 Tax=Teladorsagia circumcincta TaxID=45464 RepID=A0A2G9UB40_TELCI|nr:hypothetical protein TELCIR_10815 [Teladorsagia circumcincta]
MVRCATWESTSIQNSNIPKVQHESRSLRLKHSLRQSTGASYMCITEIRRKELKSNHTSWMSRCAIIAKASSARHVMPLIFVEMLIVYRLVASSVK